MAIIVYVIQSQSSGRLYIEQTKDLERRLSEHESGQTQSTRGRGPWTLLRQQAFATRAEAVRFERHLKNLKRPGLVLEAMPER